MFIGSCEWGFFLCFSFSFDGCQGGPSEQSLGYLNCYMLIICITSLVGTTKAV